MTPERWIRVKDALSVALKTSGTERAGVLDALCAGDPALRGELEELLGAHAEMGAFLESPAVPPIEASASVRHDLAALDGWTRYERLTELGRGGMAVVYKAWDPRLQRPVAVKLISGHDELTIKRFVREAEAQARVDHDHVLKVYETGVVGPYHYIAMQFVDGPTLMGVRGETTIEHRVELMLRIAEGLHAAHRHGLVHRDIKPSNILIDRGPEGLKPYLVDFGLAVELGSPALTKTGVVMGTPRYMAPERIKTGAAMLDRRSDIYSLGATFYEFLSGVTPFASTSGLEVLVDVMHGELAPLRSVEPTLSPDLEAIVMKCLDSEPERRYASARALADDLRRYRDGDQILARPGGPLRRLSKIVRKYPRTASAFFALALTTIALTAWGAYGYWRATRQAELAQRMGQEVRDLEWLFRAAQMSPLHPIAAEKRLVRERMSRLTGTMAEVGALGVGPGEYALGRGLLALGDNVQALQHLERAWNAGYQTADSAMALGLAHGEIFRIESGKAQRIESDAARAARVAQLQTSHRDVALSFLARGRTSSIVPARYVDAVMTALGGDVGGAVAQADAAAGERPWLFEARLLPAHLEFNEAVRLYLRGEPQLAIDWAAAADKHYAQAADIAESSLDAYLGRCAVAGLFLNMAQHRVATDAAAAYRQAEESCSRALVVDAEHGEAYRLYSDAVRGWGSLKVLKAESPGDAYERATELGARALALSDEDLEALLALADTRLDHAWWQSKSGGDPTRAVNDAVTMYEKALAIDPRNLTGANNMGQALLLLSRYQTAHQTDASASHTRAVASFARALHIDPSLSVAIRNLTKVATERADAQARQGVDLRPGLEEAIGILEALPGNRAAAERVAAVTALGARLPQQPR